MIEHSGIYLVCALCNDIAFYFKEKVTSEAVMGMPLVAEDIVFPDGTQPYNGDLARCYSCGFDIAPSLFRLNLRQDEETSEDNCDTKEITEE